MNSLKDFDIKEKTAGKCLNCEAEQLYRYIASCVSGQVEQGRICVYCTTRVPDNEPNAHVEESIRQRLNTWAECYPKGSLCYDEPFKGGGNKGNAADPL